MSDFHIQISDTQSNAVTRDSFRSDVQGLSFSDMDGGGHAACSFLVPSPTRSVTIPSWLGFSYDLKVARRGNITWRGRIEDFKRRRDSEGWPYFEIIAGGYGVALKEEYDTTRNVQGLETSAIVQNAITTLVPVIDAVSITSTGYTISGATAVTLSRMNAAAQVAWASMLGDISYNDQIWNIYDDGDGTIRFTYKPRPTAPDWYLYEVDADAFDWGLSGFASANRARANYNGGASFVMSEDAVLQGAGPDGWGRILELLTVMPELTQSVDAAQVADVLLSNSKLLRMRAEGGVFDANAVFKDSYGRRRDIWEIRAGELVQLVDVDPSTTPGTALSFANAFLVAEKEYSEDGNAVTLTPESFDALIERSLARVHTVLNGLKQAS